MRLVFLGLQNDSLQKITQHYSPRSVCTPGFRPEKEEGFYSTLPLSSASFMTTCSAGSKAIWHPSSLAPSPEWLNRACCSCMCIGHSPSPMRYPGYTSRLMLQHCCPGNHDISHFPPVVSFSSFSLAAYHC